MWMKPTSPDIGGFMGEFAKNESIGKELKFNAAVDVGIETALTLVEEKFEKSPNKEANLPFHNRRHSEMVVARVKIILETIQSVAPEIVSHYDVKLGQLIAANHDTVQNWQPDIISDGRVSRKRELGKNEEASVEVLNNFMTEQNQKSEGVFLPEDFAVAQEAIMATVPGWEPKLKTVMQPKLSERASPIALALALADIGSAGLNPEEYLEDGNAIFREDNLDILMDLENPDKVPAGKKDMNIQRMLGWSKIQVDFARGRQARLEIELQSLPDVAREKVRALFSHFDESAAAAEQVGAERARKIASGELNFETLAQEMGYKV